MPLNKETKPTCCFVGYCFQYLFKRVRSFFSKRFVRSQVMYIYSSYGGARGVMVIIVGNAHGDRSSNPGRD